jgi:hypothetical protein
MKVLVETGVDKTPPWCSPPRCRKPPPPTERPSASRTASPARRPGGNTHDLRFNQAEPL